MNRHQSDLPNYCQDTSLDEAYLERILVPAIPAIADAVTESIFEARTATSAAPFERGALLATIMHRLWQMPEQALEEVGVEFDLVPSFDHWAFAPRDDEDQAYDFYRERQDRAILGLDDHLYAEGGDR